jgi:AcrR family transcriptional regulator
MAQLAKRVGMARITVHRITAGRAGLLNELRALDAAVPKQTSVRERLLQAALSIITDRGMHALTMTAVAQRASVAPATLYRQFADRPALLSALAEVSPARHAAQELELTLSDDVEADLTRFAAALLRFFVLAGDGFLHSLVAIRHSPELARALRARSTGRTQQRLERYLAQQVNAGRLTIKNTSHAASAFLGQLAFFGWLAPTVELPRPSEHELAQYVVRLFLQGVQAL